jgi:undecaprenyl diphosphate synthase
MTLLNTYLLKEREELKANNVQLRVMGRIERLPEKSQKLLRETQEYLGECNGLVLNIALSYGGRSEIVDACRSVARRVQSGELALQDINADIVAGAMYNCDLPAPDLLIRTSGEQRLSNFMLWQMAYTEFYFTDIHWPDFRKDQLVQALYEYTSRQRRFGLLSDDVDPVQRSGEVASEELTLTAECHD